MNFIIISKKGIVNLQLRTLCITIYSNFIIKLSTYLKTPKCKYAKNVTKFIKRKKGIKKKRKAKRKK